MHACKSRKTAKLPKIYNIIVSEDFIIINCNNSLTKLDNNDTDNHASRYVLWIQDMELQIRQRNTEHQQIITEMQQHLQVL